MTRKYVKGGIACRLAAHSVIGENGCQLWTGTKNSKGYGQLTVAGKREYAHRLAFTNRSGPVPAGMVVMHSCDTPACINPDHLSVGTPAENMADKVRKGRQQSGQAVPNALLTSEQARAIRNDTRTQRVIAADYGVSRATVNDIKCGRTWAEAGGRA
jgi:hypothetical protein